MGAIPVWRGVVSESGAIVFDRDDADRRRQYLRGLIGRAVEVTVRPPRRQRSLDQNAWIWGVAYPLLGEALGYDKHEYPQLHYALLAECFGATYDQRFGLSVPRVSSSKLTTREFSDYMEWLVRWAACEHGCIIPLPNEAVDEREACDAA